MFFQINVCIYTQKPILSLHFKYIFDAGNACLYASKSQYLLYLLSLFSFENKYTYIGINI